MSKKLFSLFIDYILILIVATIIYFVIISISGILGTPSLIKEGLLTVESVDLVERKSAVLITIVFAFFYYGQPFKKYAQTIGDKIMKIKVVPENRNRIGFYWGLLRTFCLAPILAIVGLVPIPGDPEKTVLDKICFTRTIPNNKGRGDRH